MNPIIYTIGYATKPIDVFIKQLKQYGIDVVADIRSVPYSNVFYDYHKEAIIDHLKLNDIRYVYLGDELGPRSKDAAHYDDTGQVQFDRLMKAPLFLDGIERLQQGIDKGFTIALMCAEKDPATCHRSLLVGYFLKHVFTEKDNNISVVHINHDEGEEEQAELEHRLLLLNDISGDMFATSKQRESDAYHMQLKKTSYRKKQ